jgi:hypothetical protein
LQESAYTFEGMSISSKQPQYKNFIILTFIKKTKCDIKIT